MSAERDGRILQKRDMVKTIKDKSYKFEITVLYVWRQGNEYSWTY